MINYKKMIDEGKLQSGYYYVELKKGYGGESPLIVFLSPTTPDFKIVKILAKVPNYAEFKELKGSKGV